MPPQESTYPFLDLAYRRITYPLSLPFPSLPFPLLAGTLKKRNPAFVIPIESILQKLKENQDIILIDVRKKDEFEKFSIPGSINIPLFAVKTAPPFSFYSFFS